jgi:hypothetical protein
MTAEEAPAAEQQENLAVRAHLALTAISDALSRATGIDLATMAPIEDFEPQQGWFGDEGAIDDYWLRHWAWAEALRAAGADHLSRRSLAPEQLIELDAMTLPLPPPWWLKWQAARIGGGPTGEMP